MSFQNYVASAVSEYADKHYGKGPINDYYDALIALEPDPQRKKALEQKRQDELIAYKNDPVRKAQAQAQARQEMEGVLAELDGTFRSCTMTPEEITRHIQKTDPFYHFDCSPENLEKQKALQQRAKAALSNRVKQAYRDDPYSLMTFKVWGEARSQNDYGPYVGKFMSEEDKNELKALAAMVEEGEKKDPDFKKNNAEFKNRRKALNGKICRDAISRAKEKKEEYSNLTTEQMIEKFDEIYIFCRLGDTTNVAMGDLSPEEITEFHKAMNPFLNVEGYVNNKLTVLASVLGDRIDVEQIMAMDKSQILMIQGNEFPPYLEDNPAKINQTDPLAEAIFGIGSLIGQFSDALGDDEKYPQFALSDAQIAATDFDRKMLFQKLDGEVVDKDTAFEEMIRWHRPVFISSANHPEAKPVLSFMDKGKSYFGDDAAKAFEKCELPDETKPKFKPTKELSGWQIFKRGLANALEAIPLLNINGDYFRDEDITRYDEEKEAFDLEMRRYEKREQTRRMQGNAKKLTEPKLADKVQRKLYSANPKLLETVQEQKNKQLEDTEKAKTEEKKPEKPEKPEKTEEQLKREAARAKENAKKDAQRKYTEFRTKRLNELLEAANVTDQPTQNHFNQLKARVRDKQYSLYEANGMDKNERVAAALTCQMVTNLMDDSLNNMAKEGTPLPKELTELLDADDIQDKLNDMIREMQDTEALKQVAAGMSDETLQKMCPAAPNVESAVAINDVTMQVKTVKDELKAPENTPALTNQAELTATDHQPDQEQPQNEPLSMGGMGGHA